jgi:hypothetical protein
LPRAQEAASIFGALPLRSAMPAKAVSLLVPPKVKREVERAAEAEQRTVPELLHEWALRSEAKRSFNRVATKVRKLVKEQGLTEKDFGGPFAQ